jgi:glycosyltransferase involved in cell wall biosynthesis
MPDGHSWPRLSIVTPSYNQGQYIEETIRSVLLQGYPNLEYLIVDGGSTDESIEIIRRYQKWLNYWVSEPDRGQAHAINKGFYKCTGDIVGWINSDDILLPQAAERVANAFVKQPYSILFGQVINSFDYFGFGQLMHPRNITFETIIEPWRYDMFWHQPGLYVPRGLSLQVGPLDESLRYTFDWDWLCRLLQLATVEYLNQPIARFRYHSASKTVAEMRHWLPEEAIVARRYWPKVKNLDQRFAEAGLQLHMASVYLKLNNWDRSKGLQHLVNAIKQSWRVLQLRDFWPTLARVLTPLMLLRLTRTLSVFRKRWSDSSRLDEARV